MQRSLFTETSYEEHKRLERLSALGDSLPRLNQVIDWEIFRPTLRQALRTAPQSHGGRPPYDVVLMFKILILQRLYNLSDDQTEYQINDRMSFMRFLGLTLEDRIPDAKTIWLFRDSLTKAKIIAPLFNLFQERLEQTGLISRTGSIVDATFVEAPRQRNTPEENKQIKAGRSPEEWEKPDKKNKKAQKDTDARWSKKGGVTFYGYKDHVKIDAASKLIIAYTTTDARVHDSQMLPELVDERDKLLYADSAYAGKTIEEQLPETLELRILERARRGHPLSEDQKKANKAKSKVRVRIEHVFGQMTVLFHGLTLRCIGMSRAAFNIALTNLAYSMRRYECLCRQTT